MKAKSTNTKTRRTQRSAATSMPVFHVEGKMSTFGGPDDHGMRVDEDLALVTKADLNNPKFAALFLPAPPPGTTGLGRRLNPEKYYFACRWEYRKTSRDFLRNSLALLENPQNHHTAIAGTRGAKKTAAQRRSHDSCITKHVPTIES